MGVKKTAASCDLKTVKSKWLGIELFDPLIVSAYFWIYWQL
jgi:hypothetical protein